MYEIKSEKEKYSCFTISFFLNWIDRINKHACPLFLSSSGGEACNWSAFDDLVSPDGFTCSCKCPRRGKDFSRIITARQRSCGKVMYSQVCVSVDRGLPCGCYPWCIGPHCTGFLALSPRHQTWSLGSNPTTPRHQSWDSQPIPLLVSSGGPHWRPVQTCSLEDTPHRHLVAEARTVGKQAARILLERVSC